MFSGNVTTATTTASTGGFSFSGLLPSASTASTTTPATTTSASTAGFSLLSIPSTATASSGFSLTKTTAASTAGSVAASAASAISTSATPQTSLAATTVTPSSTSTQVAPTALNWVQLEENINKWTVELKEQEKIFVNQAVQVNAWNKLLIGNGEKIVALNNEVDRVKLEQEELDQELDFVVTQQKELLDMLAPLEKELAPLSVSDPERDQIYLLAEKLDVQLKQMSEDLKEIIEHLNEANRARDSSDPMVQIGKVLNAHMNSLQWLDQQTTTLHQKTQQINQMHQSIRQETERSFSLAYN